MQRIQVIDPQSATGKVKDLLEGIQKSMGKVPNIFKTMANSPSVLEGHLSFGRGLAGGVLPAKLREQIALHVAELNGCVYCLSAHSMIAKKQGLDDEEIEKARHGTSADEKAAAALKFAGKIVTYRGVVTDADVAQLRDAGYNDAEIVEITANVALDIFTNYFNHVAETVCDFPQAKPLS